MKKYCWGQWKADPVIGVIEYVPDQYEIALDQMTTNAQIMDWIFQIKTKTWGNAKAVDDFLQFIEDVLIPQENLCSDGVDFGKIDAEKLLRDYFEGVDK